mgnify:CR=1 FL=1
MSHTDVDENGRGMVLLTDYLTRYWDNRHPEYEHDRAHCHYTYRKHSEWDKHEVKDVPPYSVDIPCNISMNPFSGMVFDTIDEARLTLTDYISMFGQEATSYVYKKDSRLGMVLTTTFDDSDGETWTCDIIRFNIENDANTYVISMWCNVDHFVNGMKISCFEKRLYFCGQTGEIVELTEDDNGESGRIVTYPSIYDIEFNSYNGAMEAYCSITHRCRFMKFDRHVYPISACMYTAFCDDYELGMPDESSTVTSEEIVALMPCKNGNGKCYRIVSLSCGCDNVEDVSAMEPTPIPHHQNGRMIELTTLMGDGIYYSKDPMMIYQTRRNCNCRDGNDKVTIFTNSVAANGVTGFDNFWRFIFGDYQAACDTLRLFLTMMGYKYVKVSLDGSRSITGLEDDNYTYHITARVAPDHGSKLSTIHVALLPIYGSGSGVECKVNYAPMFYSGFSTLPVIPKESPESK